MNTAQQMDQHNNDVNTTLLDYCNLEQPPNLDENLLNKIDSSIKGMHWSHSFQCITMIRSISKFYPQYIPDIFARYGHVIVDLLTHGAPLIIKNILKLLGEIFSCGDQVNLEGCITVFLPMLIKKASN